MKWISVIALVAALVASACGTANFEPVIEIDQSNTLFITLDLPPGAAGFPDPDFNTSCRNPGDAIGSGSDVDTVLEELIDYAYEENFGVIHLCAGEYVTDDVIEFLNRGSITIQGDGIGETIISGAGGTPHPLMFMSPIVEEETETVPSNFNVLTLKDLTFTGGDATGEAFGGAIVIGGAVTAPLISTERVEFSDNAGVCGGAIALYGWMLGIFSDTFIAELGTEDPTPEDALNALSVFDTTNRSQISETTFRSNSAVIGGAIAGAGAIIPSGGEVPPFFSELGLLACQNPGPLEISGSQFEDNSSTSAEGETLFVSLGGGAIASVDSRVFILFALALELSEGFDSTWLSESTSAWAASDSTDVPWLTVNATSFVGNHTNGSGGAVAAVGNVVITSSSFMNNYAESDDDGEGPSYGEGGALYLSGGLTLTKSKFVKNSALTGGAITFQGFFGNDLTLTRNTFIRNTATDHGGAISGWSADGVARGNRFTWNRAPIGSAVAVGTDRCSRSISRREARAWRGNAFRKNRGGRLPVECVAFAG